MGDVVNQNIDAQNKKPPSGFILKELLNKPDLVDQVPDPHLDHYTEQAITQLRLNGDRFISLEAKRDNLRIKKPWWESPRYGGKTGAEHFYKTPYEKRRTIGTILNSLLDGVKDPKEMEDIHTFLKKSNFINLGEIPANFKPSGRAKDAGAKNVDESFEKKTREYLERRENAENTLYINFTGHQGAVGSALSKVGVPIYWQLNANERIVNTLQDYHESLSSNANSVQSSAVIMLEPKHGRGKDVQTDTLPQFEMVKKFKKVVIFVENLSNEQDETAEEHAKYGGVDFEKYIQNLEVDGVKIELVYVDSRFK